MEISHFGVCKGVLCLGKLPYIGFFLSKHSTADHLGSVLDLSGISKDAAVPVAELRFACCRLSAQIPGRPVVLRAQDSSLGFSIQDSGFAG